MSIILTVESLTKNYGPLKAVDNISFSVSKGEVMGLLGPNGAGKTTAIRMIMGILPLDRGRVKFAFNKNETLDKSKIGYLPEERGLYDDTKVIDNLIYLADLKNIPRTIARNEAMEWLERFNLEDHAHHKLEKLSKGMQQKVQFIASILHRPEIVLFDEPFSGLDPINQEFVKDIIKELANSGTTVLLSAHQMNLVEELCDNIFLIHQGKEVLSGSLADIKRDYREYVIKLLYDPGNNKEPLPTIPGARIIQEKSGYLSMRYSGSASVNELLEIIANNTAVEAITIEKPPLHEIFVETVKQRGDNIAI